MSRTFTDNLKEIRGGSLAHELGDRLNELVAAVRSTGKKGKLTLTLTVKPASQGDTNVLMIEDHVKVAQPELSHGSTVFYATDENELQRNDPRQPELGGLREVARHTPRNADAKGETA